MNAEGFPGSPFFDKPAILPTTDVHAVDGLRNCPLETAVRYQSRGDSVPVAELVLDPEQGFGFRRSVGEDVLLQLPRFAIARSDAASVGRRQQPVESIDVRIAIPDSEKSVEAVVQLSHLSIIPPDHIRLREHPLV